MIKIGDIFTYLTIIEETEKRTNYGSKIWLCECKCGKQIEVPTNSLTSGNTKSCGCLHKDSVKISGLKQRKLNKYDLSGEYGIGYTSKNEEFYFDLEDYDKIKDYTWKFNDNGYVINSNNKRLHRLIMNPPKHLYVDHIHGKRYDNRKSELRICTMSENLYNSKTYSKNTSGRKGVYLDKNRNKWMSIITVNKKSIHLGRFETFEEAVKVRQEAEEKYFGEYNNEDVNAILENKKETYENNYIEKEIIHIKFINNSYEHKNNLCYCKIESWNNKNTIFFVNENDYDKIKDFTWQMSNLGIIYHNDENGKILYLHQLLTNNNYIKFKDGNFNNYTLNNLQKVDITTDENLGVTYIKKRNRYSAYININKKRISLGSRYIFKEDAIIMRKMAEINLLTNKKES